MGSPEVPGLPLWFPFSPSYWQAADPGTQRTPASIGLPSESAAAGPGSSACPPPAGPDYAVSIRGLTKVYQSGCGARVALDAVDLVFRAGRVTAVLGHNGAGESMMQACMCIGIRAGGSQGCAGHNGAGESLFVHGSRGQERRQGSRAGDATGVLSPQGRWGERDVGPHVRGFWGQEGRQGIRAGRRRWYCSCKQPVRPSLLSWIAFVSYASLEVMQFA